MIATYQLWTEAPYRESLRAVGLARMSEILAYTGGRVVAWSRTTDTTFVPSGTDGSGFFLKRYLFPTWRSRWRGALRGTFVGRHRAEVEARLIREMRELGLPAVRPVAVGCRRVGHFVTASVLITEAVPGAMNLTQAVLELAAGRICFSPLARRRTIAALANYVADLHSAGYRHGQLFWRNILIRSAPGGDSEFFFLDPRPRPARLASRRDDAWLRELAQLNASALAFTTPAERRRFVVAYRRARNSPLPNSEQLARIERLAEKWRTHEAQRVARSGLFDEWGRAELREAAAATTGPRENIA